MTTSSKRQQHNKQEKQTKAKLEKLCQILKMSSSRLNSRNFNSKSKKERGSTKQLRHQDLTKLSNLTCSHVWPMSKTWPKCEQRIPLPKFTQTNLEQARSRLNILKISSQAHTPSSQV
ncbi:hypothetical protein PIB30_090908 [Stylosanthes scabra]|uniref:Uncharacterized protein n=1 Tax=Stylosanthes scabra TaxID=79078 RepID=A0ABU6TWD6_9FABA|nr:hypothetical protein [Stylosanthes scabra]